MSTHTLAMPADLKFQMERGLPGRPTVKVKPCDKDGRECAAWCADHYWIKTFYTGGTGDSLSLEETLATWPGVYRTTQVLTDGLPVDRDWPDKYRIFKHLTLRPQVWALIRDEEAAK